MSYSIRDIFKPLIKRIAVLNNKDIENLLSFTSDEQPNNRSLADNLQRMHEFLNGRFEVSVGDEKKHLADLLDDVDDAIALIPEDSNNKDAWKGVDVDFFEVLDGID